MDKRYTLQKYLVIAGFGGALLVSLVTAITSKMKGA
jgi:hypothetical protein